MENNETIEEFTVPEILESFRTFDEIYKREHIDAAILKTNGGNFRDILCLELKEHDIH